MRLLFTLLLTYSLSVKAQYSGPFNHTSRDFENKYSSFLGEGETRVRSWYYYVVTEKDGNYILRQFNPEKAQLYSETVFSDKKLKTKNGSYREFDYDGSGYLTGQYSQNQKVGIWKGFYISGTPRSNAVYINGSQEGESKIWYENGQLKSITEYRSDKRNGKKLEYYESGNIRTEHNYVDDKLEGDFFLYDSLGGVLDHWIYKDDEVEEFVIGKLANEQQPQPLFSDCGEFVNTEEYRKCQISKMYRHIGKNIRYPKIDQRFDVSGRVFVKFVVEKNGEILEAEILRGLTESMNNEAIRVIKSMSPWTPGYQNGEPVRVWFTMPIFYQLE